MGGGAVIVLEPVTPISGEAARAEGGVRSSRRAQLLARGELGGADGGPERLVAVEERLQQRPELLERLAVVTRRVARGGGGGVARCRRAARRCGAAGAVRASWPPLRRTARSCASTNAPLFIHLVIPIQQCEFLVSSFRNLFLSTHSVGTVREPDSKRS